MEVISGLAGITKTLVQCDFDGTVTEEDVSFAMLDAFASGDWQQLFRQYEEGKISVGRFNTEAFAMVRADRQSLLDIVMDRVRIRPGLPELVECCRKKNYHFTIVSNGLDFYIEEILKSLGLNNIEVHAARTDFKPDGLAVQYVGPDGIYLDDSFKLAFVNSFLNEDYRIIYVGNGNSDFEPARQCHDIFATGALLKRCKETNTACNPFNDLNEIIKVLEGWK